MKHGYHAMDESGAGGIKGSTRSYCDPLGKHEQNRHRGGGGGARLRRLGQPRGQATHGEVGRRRPLCRAVDNEGARGTAGRQPCGQAPTETSSGGARMGRPMARALIRSVRARARARASEAALRIGRLPTATSSGGARMGRPTARAWIPSSQAIARARASERDTSGGYGMEDARAARECACALWWGWDFGCGQMTIVPLAD